MHVYKMKMLSGTFMFMNIPQVFLQLSCIEYFVCVCVVKSVRITHMERTTYCLSSPILSVKTFCRALFFMCLLVCVLNVEIFLVRILLRRFSFLRQDERVFVSFIVASAVSNRMSENCQVLNNFRQKFRIHAFSLTSTSQYNSIFSL